MEATTAQANELERRIDLSIAIADVEKEMEQRLKRMGKNIKMSGFRPGKVPFSIVKQQYGDQARHEVLSEELDRVFGETVTAQKMRVAGYPRIEPKVTESTTHLEFSAIFEVYPEFTPGDMSTAEVERPVLEVGAPKSTRPSTSCASSAFHMKTPTAPPPRKTASSSTSSARRTANRSRAARPTITPSFLARA
jgi:FKBP-type peptidyl-prolyl cis-trans isomerase (trigger factor)